MSKFVNTFERLIVIVLLGLMMVTVFAATVELLFILVQELIRPPMMLLNLEEMLEVFGFFLMVLIGLELITVIKAFVSDDIVHAEIVFLVAIVAISRKVIIMDIKETSPETLYGMAAIIISLGVGYYLLQRALEYYKEPSKNE